MSHLSRNHRGIDLDSVTEHAIPDLEQDLNEHGAQDHPFIEGLQNRVEEHEDDQPAETNLQRSAAQFLITLKEKFQITQTALDFAITQVEQMMYYSNEDLKAKVQLALQQYSVEGDIELREDVLSDCFRIDSPFSGLQTEHMQTKYYKDNFGLVVSVSSTIIMINNYNMLNCCRSLWRLSWADE